MNISYADSLPQLKGDIVLAPFLENGARTGRTLVSSGDRMFAVNPEAVLLLEALKQQPKTFDELSAVYEREGRRPLTREAAEKLIALVPNGLWSHNAFEERPCPITWRIGFLSEEILERVTSRVQWLYSKHAVFPLLFLFFVIHIFTLLKTGTTPARALSGIEDVVLCAAVIASMLVHEIGHATACARYGARHGGVGMGFFWIFPVFYADVTRAWSLSPNQRAVVDLGGVYFQVLFLIPIDAFIFFHGSDFFLTLLLFLQYLMVQTLNPIWKMDGYWLLTDISGLSNLHRQAWLLVQSWWFHLRRQSPLPRPAASHFQEAILACYVVACFGYSVILYLLLARIGHYIFHDYPQALISVRGDFRQHLGTLIRISFLPGLTAVAILSVLVRTGRWAATHCSLRRRISA